MLGRSFPRRRFLQGALAAGAFGRRFSFAQADTASASWVLLGTQGAGIYRARWNSRTGTLGTPELAIATPKPTYLVLHPSRPVVYACNEGEGDAAQVSAFALDRTTATLSALGSQPSKGNSPCFVSVDRTGRLLFAANYGGGSLSAFPLDLTGVAGAAANNFSCKASGLCGTPGPVHDRQDGPHIHCATLSPDNRFVLACDLGDDAILAFPINPDQSAPLGPVLGPVQRLPARLGSGPRHLAFHPNGRWLYCIHELDCTVDRYDWTSSSRVANAQLVPSSITHLTLASEAVTGQPDTAAEVVISHDGSYLYACTRGIDRISVFRIDRTTGALKLVQQLPCGGHMPRFFALDPTEKWLVCTNQDGNNITTFARDASVGTLTAHSSQALATPQCVVWL